jgi:hypothetical protein
MTTPTQSAAHVAGKRRRYRIGNLGRIQSGSRVIGDVHDSATKEERRAIIDGLNTQWLPIATHPHPDCDLTEVDLWMVIHPSAMSMGFGDAFRIVDCYRWEGKWVHRDRGEIKPLREECLTHWRPTSKPANLKGAQCVPSTSEVVEKLTT